MRVTRDSWVISCLGTRQASSNDTSLTRARYLLFPSTRDASGTSISVLYKYGCRGKASIVKRRGQVIYELVRELTGCIKNINIIEENNL